MAIVIARKMDRCLWRSCVDWPRVKYIIDVISLGEDRSRVRSPLLVMLACVLGPEITYRLVGIPFVMVASMMLML